MLSNTTVEQSSSCHFKSRFYSFYISALGLCGKVLIVRIELATEKKYLKKEEARPGERRFFQEEGAYINHLV